MNENKAVEPWAVKFTGEANEAVLLDRPNHWALAVRFNGEYTVREQGFIAQRIAVAAAGATVTKTSDPVQAALWLGKRVEADKAMDPECQPSEYNEGADEYEDLPIRGKLVSVFAEGAWILADGSDEATAVEWPIRLLEGEADA